MLSGVKMQLQHKQQQQQQFSMWIPLARGVKESRCKRFYLFRYHYLKRGRFQ